MFPDYQPRQLLHFFNIRVTDTTFLSTIPDQAPNSLSFFRKIPTASTKESGIT